MLTTSERTVGHEGGARTDVLDPVAYVVRADGWPIGTFDQCLGLPDDATFGYGLAGTVRLTRSFGVDSGVLAAWVASGSRPARCAVTITAYDTRGVAFRAWRLRDAWPLRHRVWAVAEQLLLAHTGILRSLP